MAQDYFYQQQLVKLTEALEFNNLGLNAWCDQFIDELVAQHQTQLMFIYDDVVNMNSLILNACRNQGRMDLGMETVALIAHRTAERLMNSYGFGRPDIVQVIRT